MSITTGARQQKARFKSGPVLLYEVDGFSSVRHNQLDAAFDARIVSVYSLKKTNAVRLDPLLDNDVAFKRWRPEDILILLGRAARCNQMRTAKVYTLAQQIRKNSRLAIACILVSIFGTVKIPILQR